MFGMRPLGLIAAALMHPVLDMCTTDVYEHYAGQHHGIPLLWPFSGTEYSAVLGLFRAPYVGADAGRLFGSENLTVLVRDTAAALLALLLHPAMLWLGQGIQQVYPVSPDVLAQLKPLDEMIGAAPWWQVLLLIALVPAVCEELAFRGFILSGLRRMGHKWGAIVLTSVFFGVTHSILQQSLSACVVGIVIGYIAVKTGSLLPGVLYHLAHNGLSVALGRVTPEVLERILEAGKALS